MFDGLSQTLVELRLLVCGIVVALGSSLLLIIYAFMLFSLLSAGGGVGGHLRVPLILSFWYM